MMRGRPDLRAGPEKSQGLAWWVKFFSASAHWSFGGFAF